MFAEPAHQRVQRGPGSLDDVRVGRGASGLSLGGRGQAGASAGADPGCAEGATAGTVAVVSAAGERSSGVPRATRIWRTATTRLAVATVVLTAESPTKPFHAKQVVTQSRM